MAMLGTLRELPRTVWLLGLVSFFNDTSSELIYPLVPIYLASVLMAGPKALGIIEGIAEATGSLLKLFAGVLSDRRRSTRPWVVGGYALEMCIRDRSSPHGRPSSSLRWSGHTAARCPCRNCRCKDSRH